MTDQQDALQGLQDLIDSEQAALAEGKGDAGATIRRIEEAIADTPGYKAGPGVQEAMARLRAAINLDRISTALED
jgi:hypothetical protein